ncbi:MAG: type II toxin-antitoxin system PemK/MazF family toxin [Proteobacteria bacterium]|nr:type II toxin-antitoxin system PemK/MazF family toxin [Pseudomonadota bacterium]
MVVHRGEIWWASLIQPSGSEPGYRRPVIIVQSNDFNTSQIKTIVAIVITSNLNLAKAPGNVLLKKKQTKLSKDSVANVSQIVTLDKSYLTEKVGVLTSGQLSKIEDGLRLVLSL